MGKEKSAKSAAYPLEFCKEYAVLAVDHFEKTAKSEFLEGRLKLMRERVDFLKGKAYDYVQETEDIEADVKVMQDTEDYKKSLEHKAKMARLSNEGQGDSKPVEGDTSSGGPSSSPLVWNAGQGKHGRLQAILRQDLSDWTVLWLVISGALAHAALLGWLCKACWSSFEYKFKTPMGSLRARQSRIAAERQWVEDQHPSLLRRRRMEGSRETQGGHNLASLIRRMDYRLGSVEGGGRVQCTLPQPLLDFPLEHGTPGEQGEGDGEDAVHLEEGNINTKDKGNMGYAKEFMAKTAAKLRDWINSPRKQSATSPSGATTQGKPTCDQGQGGRQEQGQVGQSLACGVETQSTGAQAPLHRAQVRQRVSQGVQECQEENGGAGARSWPS